MVMTIASVGPTFGTGHIALTGALSGIGSGIFAAVWLRGDRRWLESAVIAVIVAAAVFLFRQSANMPQLNDDGLSGFSANDWLAPAVTFAALGVYGSVRRPTEPRRFAQVQGVAAMFALIVNVVTI